MEKKLWHLLSEGLGFQSKTFNLLVWGRVYFVMKRRKEGRKEGNPFTVTPPGAHSVKMGSVGCVSLLFTGTLGCWNWYTTGRHLEVLPMKH